MFQKGELPSKINEINITYNKNSTTLPRILKDSGLVASTSEAIRLIKQGAIRIDGETILNAKIEISQKSSNIYQVGKRKFIKIKIT